MDELKRTPLHDLHLALGGQEQRAHIVSKFQFIGCPIKIDSNPVGLKVPPLLGEHSDEVLSSILDIASPDLSKLREEGVI